MANCVQCGRKLPPLTLGRKICQWCVQHERAQRGEEVEDVPQPVIRRPWVRGESTITVTHVLFGANVAVFVAMVVATILNGSLSSEFSGELRVHFGSNFGPRTLSGDWWRLFTYMFVHADIFHIAFNMWCLWDLGALCESLYGRWTFGAIYVICGVAGGLASIGWNPIVNSVGASGAVFGLAGALIASLYLGEFSLPKDAIRMNMRSLLFFAGFNILFGISDFGEIFGFGRVDNACHIGGLVSGLILGALIARVAPDRNAAGRRAGVLAVVALGLAGCVWGVVQWRGTPFRIGRALDSLAEKNPNRGITQLEAIVKQQPNSVQGHYALAQAYFSRDRLGDAEAEFKRVLALQPSHEGARFRLGLVYLTEKRSEDARAAFGQLVAQDASSGDGHYGLGLALSDEGKGQAAIAEFKEAARLGTPYPGVYYEMGQSYARLKMYDEAIAAYLQGKNKDGDDPDLENGLADAYEAKGMKQQAQEARGRADELKGGK